jgi:ADP-ribose pyrophosphatase YjhB (NUDIX family)
MGIIIVGGVIKKDNKYLLVQEAKEKCRGKWNIPAGHLDPNETVFEGAKREVFEECGYNVELTGIACIGNRVMVDNEFLLIIFSTEIIDGEPKFNEQEILDLKWFSYEEIMQMHNELRSYDWITDAITAVEKNNINNIDIIKIIK